MPAAQSVSSRMLYYDTNVSPFRSANVTPVTLVPFF
jgi:hypothetical protein